MARARAARSTTKRPASVAAFLLTARKSNVCPSSSLRTAPAKHNYVSIRFITVSGFTAAHCREEMRPWGLDVNGLLGCQRLSTVVKHTCGMCKCVLRVRRGNECYFHIIHRPSLNKHTQVKRRTRTSLDFGLTGDDDKRAYKDFYNFA